MTKATELILLDSDELVTRLGEARKEMFNLRFQLATGQLDNSARMNYVRRDIARILTVLRSREIDAFEEIEGSLSGDDDQGDLVSISAGDEEEN